MKGTTTKKGGRWYVVYDVGLVPARRCASGCRGVRVWRESDAEACPRCHGPLTDPVPERRQRWEGSWKRQKDAQAALDKIKTQITDDTYVEPSKATVSEFTAEWLDAIRSTVRASTHRDYRAKLELHVLPRLGEVELRRLRPEQLNALYSELLESGRRDGGGGLSPRSVRYIATVIHRMLRDAVRWGRIARNVAELADPPTANAAKAAEQATWTAEEVGAFLESVRSERLYAAWTLLATTGMRRGEVLGLRWANVDLDAGRLSVRESLVRDGYELRVEAPKTERSRRQVELAPETVAALKAWRKTQLEEKLAWGPAYQDGGLVFSREDGSPIHPDRFTKWFEQRVRRAGLPAVRLHDLRHTWATLSLRAGVPLEVVSRMLGHSSIAITADVYQHAVPQLQRDAAAKVAGLIFEVPR